MESVNYTVVLSIQYITLSLLKSLSLWLFLLHYHIIYITCIHTVFLQVMCLLFGLISTAIIGKHSAHDIHRWNDRTGRLFHNIVISIQPTRDRDFGTISTSPEPRVALHNFHTVVYNVQITYTLFIIYI